MSGVNDVFFKALVHSIAQGLLAGQTDDHRYLDTPGKDRYEHLAEDAIAYANAVVLKLSQLEK